MYVKRDSTGAVCAISREAAGGFDEEMAADTPELVSFMRTLQPQAYQALLDSDLQMARVLEDTINVLMDKGILRFTDLPEAAQQKLLHRREIRGRFNAIDLLDEEDDIGL